MKVKWFVRVRVTLYLGSLICHLTDDWNLGEKSGRWHLREVQQRLQFDYDVETFFTIDVVSIRDQRTYNKTDNKTATIRVFTDCLSLYYQLLFYS
jgi:hypothetical protein